MRIFVYGSLLKGFSNHERLLTTAKFVGYGETLPAYTLISLGSFPGMLDCGSTSIKGEIYDVTPEVAHRLDSLEGHPTFYRRTSITLKDGIEVEVYILQENGRDLSGYEVVESGDWHTWFDSNANRWR